MCTVSLLCVMMMMSSHQETTKERHEMLSDLIVWSFQRLEDPSLNSNMSLKGAIADFILALTMHTDTSEVVFDLMCDQNAWRRIMALLIDSFEDKQSIEDLSKFTEINLNRTERENTLVSLMCLAGRACQDLTHGSIARLVFGKSATSMLLAFLKQSDVEQRRDVWSIRGVLQYTRDRRVKNARRNSDKDADDLAVCVLRFGTTRRWSGFCECHEVVAFNSIFNFVNMTTRDVYVIGHYSPFNLLCLSEALRY